MTEETKLKAEPKVKVISHKIPKITMTAVTLARANFQANLQEIAEQTLEALQLNKDDRWNVNLDTGFITREIVDNA